MPTTSEGVPGPVVLFFVAIAIIVGAMVGSCTTNKVLCQEPCERVGFTESNWTPGVTCHCITRGKAQQVWP
jgi:hypothetical protein